MLSGRVPEELKQLVDADPRPNQEVMRVVLWSEFGGEREGEIRTRIREKRNRKDVIREEKQTRADEMETLDEEIDALESKLDKVESADSERAEKLYRKVRKVPKEPDHPLIQNVSEELDMDPDAVINEAYDR